MTTVTPHPPELFPIIAIASSAGGLSALSTLLSGLSPSLHAALVMVQHLDPRHPSLMAEILTRKSEVTVRQAVNGDLLQPDTAFIADGEHATGVGGGSDAGQQDRAHAQHAWDMDLAGFVTQV